MTDQQLLGNPVLINLVARVLQDNFPGPDGHLLLSKREAVAQEILDGLGMLGCVRRPAPPIFEGAPAGLQLDILTLLIRLQQINEEVTPGHYLWDRVITCDGPRLYSYLEPATLEWLKLQTNADIQEVMDRYLTEWTPGRWYRVLQPDGSLWMETSDAQEAAAAAKNKGWQLYHQWRWERTEWRPMESEVEQ